MTKGIGYKKRTPGSLHEVLTKAFEQAGGVKAVADILPGRTVPRLYEAASEGLDPRHEVQLTLAEARLLARASHGKATIFAEDMALLLGGVFLPPLAAGGTAVGAQAGRAGREVGEAMTEIYAALEDGVMTLEEAKRALPQIHEAAQAIAGLYGLVKAVIDQGADQPPEPSKP